MVILELKLYYKYSTYNLYKYSFCLTWCQNWDWHPENWTNPDFGHSLYKTWNMYTSPKLRFQLLIKSTEILNNYCK